VRALVTGGTSGVGAALCDLLEKRGYTVIRAGSALCDLRYDRTTLIELLRAEPIDLLVNCAGYTLFGDAASREVKEELEIAEVNGLAPLELTLEAVRTWIDLGRRGTVLNVSSLLAQLSAPGAAVYAASKAFVDHFTKSLDYEVRPLGIRIYSCALGQVRSNFFDEGFEFDSGSISCAEAADWLLSRLGKRGTLHQIWGRHGTLTRLARLLPAGLVNKIVHATMRNRKR